MNSCQMGVLQFILGASHYTIYCYSPGIGTSYGCITGDPASALHRVPWDGLPRHQQSAAPKQQWKDTVAQVMGMLDTWDPNQAASKMPL